MHYAAWASDVDDPVPRGGRLHGQGLRARGRQRGDRRVDPDTTGAWVSPGSATAHVFYRRAKQNDLLLGAHGTLHLQHSMAGLYLGAA
ncbi:MAG: hypothetical protein U5R31_00960 [Acidimicrobiia bacterium]|nr:hypothetical protein [Acidimicrobiia bacterium]